jgi:hypothetical protein
MSSIELIIEPRTRDLGGFTVGRILPFARRRMVGPFIFFDVIGPAQFEPGSGIDVRPHPHIGLATVTYLFEGAFRHRDSLGYDQVIRPGDVNWMTAGRGIVHSERTDDPERASGQKLHGVQSWVALPDHAEETEPAFQHCPKAALPTFEKDGCMMRVIAGTAFGETSPVKTFSGILYVDVLAEAGAVIPLPDEHEERALFVAEGAASVDGQIIKPGQMAVPAPGSAPRLTAQEPSRLMLLGGAPVGERLIWWNLVASRQALIDRAKKDWMASAEKGFDKTPFPLPPGEREHIPLPEN